MSDWLPLSKESLFDFIIEYMDGEWREDKSKTIEEYPFLCPNCEEPTLLFTKEVGTFESPELDLMILCGECHEFFKEKNNE